MTDKWIWSEYPEYSVEQVDTDIVKVTWEDDGTFATFYADPNKERWVVRYFHKDHVPAGNYLADAAFAFFEEQGATPKYDVEHSL